MSRSASILSPYPMKIRTVLLLIHGGFSLTILHADITKPKGLPVPKAEPVTAAFTPPQVKNGFEPPVTLSASAVLAPEVRSGPSHRVREQVPTDGYMAHFTIDSDYGTFECTGIEQVQTRVNEVYAIQKLMEVSKGDLFAEGLKRSIEQPVDAVKNIVKDPVGTVKAVPKTVGHFFTKVGRSIETAADKVKEKSHEEKGSEEEKMGERAKDVGQGIGQVAKGVIGFDSARLACARQLGVDPYADNARLQDEMEKVSWVFFAGGLPLKLGASAASGGASAVLTGTRIVGLPDEVYTLSPSELNLRNLDALAAMKVDETVKSQFVTNEALSLTLQRSILRSLEVLGNIAGRESVVELAAGCVNRTQAEFLDRSLKILVQRQQTLAYREITVYGRLIGATDTSGALQVPAPVDYVSWTGEVAAFAHREDLVVRKPLLLLSGDASPQVRAEMAAAGWTLVRP